MENVIIWSTALIIVGVIFTIYYRKFRKDQQVAFQRKEEARALGIDRPRAQFPMIDSAYCIGCGSCAAACPEGDVIGVVWGTATIINGERCVGHGYCEQVCPVGAIKVGLGDVRTRPDIPILSEVNETSVPGIFIAGELGGISLIRNAVSQGKLVVETIANRIGTSLHDSILDVLIVGAGPAGLTAALTAIKRRLNYLVIDEDNVGGTILHYPRQKLVMTQPIDIPLYGRLEKEEYTKEFLMGTWQEIVQKYGVKIQTGERLQTIKRHDNGLLEVHTNHDRYRTRNVVLAMGRRGTPRKLDVDGEELPKVFYQLIDAQSYNGMDLLVVGGGDSAVEAAVGLARQQGNRVTISYRKNGFFRVKKKNEERINELIKAGKIKPIGESHVQEVTPTSVKLATKNGEIEIVNDYVFVFIGGVPPFDMLRDIGVNFGGEAKPILSQVGVA